ncbi:MAG: hypothetical protein Q9166_001802 [cf. Caloplaca sp. 2 TL-2023]
MCSIWRLVLFLPCLILAHALAIDRSQALSFEKAAISPNISSSPLKLPSSLLLRTTKRATRQLVEHWDLMYITYHPSTLIPTSLYQHLLSTAITRITHKINTLGDDAYVETHFLNIAGNVMLQADNNRHSASRELTWGILGEAVEVLQEFTRDRPYALEAGIWDGLDGRGVPVGEMTVSVHTIPHAVHGGSVRGGRVD